MEKTFYPDYFNDVFRPIMQPGSSGSFAGMSQVGRLARTAGILYEFAELDEDSAYPGGVTFELTGQSGDTAEFVGESGICCAIASGAIVWMAGGAMARR
jgi:L-serine deaminase